MSKTYPNHKCPKLIQTINVRNLSKTINVRNLSKTIIVRNLSKLEIIYTIIFKVTRNLNDQNVIIQTINVRNLSEPQISEIYPNHKCPEEEGFSDIDG